MKIKIKNRHANSNIFEFNGETIKFAVEKAVGRGIDLSGAYLRGADLNEAYLRGAVLVDADLSGAVLVDADLSGANLIEAILRNADLGDANLSGANLSGADLSGANLSGVNLRGATGNTREICSMQMEGWHVVFAGGVLAIGCQQHSMSEWIGFNDAKISAMHSNALDWWKKWRDFIFMAIELKYGIAMINVFELPINKFSVDDKVMATVNACGFDKKYPAHFAGVNGDGKPMIFPGGKTSFTHNDSELTVCESCEKSL